MPQKKTPEKSSPIWLVISVVILALIFSLTVYLLSHQSKKTPENVSLLLPSRTAPQNQATQSAVISPEEKIKMDEWIEKNQLNVYGDTKDTVYNGSTPLFNKMNGNLLDRYEYILQKHPDRPWKN